MEKNNRNLILDANLDALKRNFPHIYQKVQNHTPSAIGQIIKSKNGLPNILFHFKDDKPMIAYNPNDPLIDGNLFLKSINEEERILIMFIGLGLGYGPLQVIKERPKLVRLVIVEPWMDMFMHAIHLIDLTPIFNSKRVLLYVGEFEEARFEGDLQRTAAIFSTRILEFPLGQKVRKDLYKKVSDKVFEIANKLNAHGSTTMNCGGEFFQNRYDSLTLLRHSYSYDILRDSFKNMPAIMVAAGPSLDDDMELLKTLKNKALIITADSALSPLLKAGITPDIVTTLDFQKVNFEKLTPFVDTEKEWEFMLVSMIKGSSLVQKRFPVSHLILGFMTDLPHMWIAKELGVKCYAPPAFSVAHVSMGVALLSGANPIIFLGQDLGFTSTEDDHATGTIFSSRYQDRKDYISIKGLDGGEIKTDRSLLGIKTLFEDIIKSNPKKVFINSTSRGAYIDGAMRLRLDEVKSLYLKDEIDIKKQSDHLKNTSKTFEPARLIKEMESRIELARSGIKKINKFNELYDEFKPLLKKFMEKKNNIRSLEELDIELKTKLHKITTINIELDKLYKINEAIIELNFKFLGENEVQKIYSDEMKIQKGVIFWLESEIERFKNIEDGRKLYFQKFIKTANSVRDFLLKEGNLIENYKKNQDDMEKSKELLIELSSLCIDYENPVIALNYLKKIDESFNSLPQSLYLNGCVNAQLLKFDNAKKCWLNAIKENPDYIDQINKFAIKEAELWTELAHKRLSNDKIVSVMVNRIASLIQEPYFTQLPPGTVQIWEFYKTKNENDLKEQPEELEKKLKIWEPLKPYLEKKTP